MGDPPLISAKRFGASEKHKTGQAKTRKVGNQRVTASWAHVAALRTCRARMYGFCDRLRALACAAASLSYVSIRTRPVWMKQIRFSLAGTNSASSSYLHTYNAVRKLLYEIWCCL